MSQTAVNVAPGAAGADGTLRAATKKFEKISRPWLQTGTPVHLRRNHDDECRIK